MYGCVFEKDRVSGDEIHTISADGTPPQAPRTAASCFAGTDAVLGGFLLGAARAVVEEPAEQPVEQTVEALPLSPASTAEAQPVLPASTAEAQPLESAASSQEDVWQLRLVSAAHPLPEDFEVPELTKLRGGHAIDSRAYPALQQMMDDWPGGGTEPGDLLVLPDL